MKITKINPIDSSGLKQTKLRVAAYCRVSTDETDQLYSLESQTTHFENLIKSNSQWVFAGLYVDEGISGTKADRREAFNRLLSDCNNKKVDLIVIKSISRFSRNTVDCIKAVRELKARGVYIFFEKENLNTGTEDSEFLLTILSSFAEEESLSVSQNIKWSVKRRFQEGKYKLCAPPYGYTYNGETMVPVPEEAEVVRRIFNDILSGLGTTAVAKRLNAGNIRTKRGCQWSQSSIRGIISNEKYVGDSLYQKTYTDEHFVTHRNKGEETQYLIQNSHESIIDRETFNLAQQLIRQRGLAKGVDYSNTDKYNVRYAFSGLIICGACNAKFKRRINTKNKDEKYVAWSCSTHLDDKNACIMLYMKEEIIKNAFNTMFHKLSLFKNEVLLVYINDLKKYCGGTTEAEIISIENQLKDINRQVKVLTDFAQKGYLEPALFNEKNNQLQVQIQELREQKQILLSGNDGENNAIFEATELHKYLSKNANAEYSDEIFKRFVSEIIVFSPTLLGFRLKCGLLLKEEITR